MKFLESINAYINIEFNIIRKIVNFFTNIASNQFTTMYYIVFVKTLFSRNFLLHFFDKKFVKESNTFTKESTKELISRNTFSVNDKKNYRFSTLYE